MENKKIIEKAVNEFFGTAKTVYAIPGTINYNANFYGDAEINELSREEICYLIEISFQNRNQGDNLQIVIQEILSDLQHDIPEI